jgi:prolyl oligopeptidase
LSYSECSLHPQVKDEIYLYSRAGIQLARLAPDFVGVASVANREKQPHFFLVLSGFNTPGTIAFYDFGAQDAQRYSIFRTTTVDGLDPDDFETTQVWYESKDGTKIPMFVVRHKSTKFDGTAGAIQFGTLVHRNESERNSSTFFFSAQVMVDSGYRRMRSSVR